MENLKVNLVQCHQFWEDKKANFDHISNLMKDASPSDIVILPEMFNTGFTMSTHLAEDENGESIVFLRSLAKLYNTIICASMMFQTSQGTTNRLVVVNEHGIQHFYDKVHLFSLAREDQFFIAGQEKKVIEIKGWRILLQICYDLRFPVFSRYTSEFPYDVALYLANWPEKRRHAWISLLQARAIENQSYVIGCNRVGKDDNGLSYSGDSRVYDALGEVVLKSTHNEEGVKYFELYHNDLTEVRSKLPFLMDADHFTVKSKKYIDK